MALLVIGLIRLYQTIVSPLLAPACRFYPSCSQYAIDALTRRGLFAGSWLALARLARCHPWHPGGVEFVPEASAPRPLRHGAWR